MSVVLCKLKGIAGEFDDVEVMAPDYDVERIWLWSCPEGADRIDLSLEQAKKLRDYLDKLLAIVPKVGEIMNTDKLLTDECHCGHVRDEHEHTQSSTPPCAVEGCDCFAFESANGDEDSEDR